jgi:Ice-binding-like
MINGAQACNVLWQVGSFATLDTTIRFIGNVITHALITTNTGAVNHGELHTLAGQINLQSNCANAQEP